MKIPFLKFFEKKVPSEYYMALILRNEKAISVIFEKQGNTIKYIGTDEEFFENTIEDATQEQFLDTLDKVITSAESSLPENIETHKTIFGLKESWVEDNKIKKEYLEKLKKAGEELALEPIGFLIFTESIISLVHKDEGAPVTAILADIGKKFITVSWVKGGKILETRSSEIHESFSYTVDTLLKHFQTPGNLPARIILLDSEEDELEQEFISHQWSKSLSFLHLPQIMNLPKDASVKAMLLGAATQMGAQLLYSSNIDIDEKPQKIERVEIENASLQVFEKPTIEHVQNALDYVQPEASLEYFGFSEKDVSQKLEPDVKNPLVSDNLNPEKIAEIPEEVKEEGDIETPVPVNAMLVTIKIKKFLTGVPIILSKITFNKQILINLKPLVLKNKKFAAGITGFLILLIILLFVFLFGEKAIVNIIVNPKQDEKTTSVTFSPTLPTDIKNGVLSEQAVTVSEDGEDTITTTGTKNIGNSAKGTVTVFNNDTAGSVTFPQGTTITSSNNLNFTTDSSVTVASASGDIFSGTKPGTTSVNVTASDIGQNYNLPSGTKFTIGTNANVAAKNDNAFQGGTSKKVNTVSDSDIQKLLTDLPKTLEQKAQNDIKSKVSLGQIILPQFIDETVSGKSFDKKSGDQANQVSIKGTVDFEAVSYQSSDLLSLAQTLFDTSSVILSKNNLTADAKNIVISKNKDVSADLSIKAKILPVMDIATLANQIKGIPVTKAKNILSNLDQVESVTISLKPNILFFNQNLPQNTNNITIIISSN